MYRSLAVAIAFLAVAIPGAIAGVWTQRWGITSNLSAAAQAAQLPATAGEWDSREERCSPAELKSAQAAAISRRIYINRRTGDVASVLLVCGRAGPVAVHTPEVCFPSTGYDVQGPRNRMTTSGGDGAQVWHTRFKKSSDNSLPISVYYAWNDGTQWLAPDQPRVTYAHRPVLFKLYVVRERMTDVNVEMDDMTADLFRSLLPLLKTRA